MRLLNLFTKPKKQKRVLKPEGERRSWDWDSPNPTSFSLIRAGHSIVLENRYEVGADPVLETIKIVDLHTMESISDMKGITKENLASAITTIKKIIKCPTPLKVKD